MLTRPQDTRHSKECLGWQSQGLGLYVCLFSCTALFVSIRQVIGCEDRLRNDLLCVEWGVKLYSLTLGLFKAKAVGFKAKATNFGLKAKS